VNSILFSHRIITCGNLGQNNNPTMRRRMPIKRIAIKEEIKLPSMPFSSIPEIYDWMNMQKKSTPPKIKTALNNKERGAFKIYFIE
jgi:hypothetical protein